MHYNLDYALRLCSQNNRMQSCVHIYSQMGLYEEAVSLSLKVRRGGFTFFLHFRSTSLHLRTLYSHFILSSLVS
jgi:hypothetical protein